MSIVQYEGKNSLEASSCYHLFIQMEDIQWQAIEDSIWPAVRRHSPAHLTATEAAVILQKVRFCALHDAWPIGDIWDVGLSARSPSFLFIILFSS